MALLVVGTIDQDGAVNNLVAAGVGGDTFPNTGREFFEVDNADASPITVIIATPGTVAGLAIVDGGGSVTNGTRVRFGPFQTSIYGSTISVTYSSVTAITVEAVQLPATGSATVTP